MYISIITLNVNGLNAPTRKQRLAERIQKQDPFICCLPETHFRPKDTYRLKVRGWKNIFHANGKQKKAGVAILTSDKIELNIKNITRDKEGQFSSVPSSHSVVLNSLQPHGCINCPSPLPGVYLNMSIESVMPSNHLILCRPPLLPPSIFPSIRIFSNESALHIRWPKYWSFSLSISPSNEHPVLISFWMDWLDLLAV